MRPLLTAAALAAGLAAIAAGRATAFQPMPVELYSQECGACHMSYPAQLLPPRSWQALLGALDHHFGENATLDPATVAAISAYLAANAAGSGSPALDGLGPHDVPLRITGTPYWRGLHAGIAPARFSSAKVKSPANCLACHGGGGRS